MLENEESTHNISSDILESTFGIYKQRKSPNKLYGVTSFILIIPAYTQLGERKKADNYFVKEHLENVRLKHIQQWSELNLTTNLVMKRRRTLKSTG